MRVNTVKQALREGRVQLGCSCFQLRSPDAVRALAAAGLDWVFFDGEHGAYGFETLQDLMRVATGVGLCPIVRVADLDYALIARALDCGAEGVLLPRVESPELLAKAVSWTRFPPMGARGFGLAAPHLDYEPVSIPDAIAHVNANVLVVLQIETRTALERIDELLAVPNIDAVLVGPGDLSISLGVPGQFDHPNLSPPSRPFASAATARASPPGSICGRSSSPSDGRVEACASLAATAISDSCWTRPPRRSRC